MINPDLERFKAKLIKATTIELTSSHVPMISQPDQVTDFIISAAEKLSSTGPAENTQAKLKTSATAI